MTEDERERLKRRFGDDIDAWPAPYRQEARRFADGGRDDEADDNALDRLVLEAALTQTDEQVLARKVLQRTRGERRGRPGLSPMMRPWGPRGAAAGFAAILLAAGIAGYLVAEGDDARLGDALLALATGFPSEPGIELGLSGSDGGDAGLEELL
jgi:hypothetical protein